MPEVGRLTKRPEFLRAAGRGRLWPTRGLVLQAYCRSSQETPVRVVPFVRLSKEASESLSKGPAASSEADNNLAAQQIRVGFTASKKVGSAVARNRARRRLRAVAADLLPRLGNDGTDYVLIARAGTLTRDFDDLTRDLTRALEVVALPEEAYRERQNKIRRSGPAGRNGSRQASRRKGGRRSEGTGHSQGSRPRHKAGQDKLAKGEQNHDT
ncbi:ribonuclease P protein component [Rhodovibrionaceae bacterium A322]